MAKNKISFKLKNKLSELDTLCQKLEGFGESIGLSPKFIFETNLALDELFTNIISYGYSDKKVHHITVTISLQDNQLLFSIEDDGIPFNPLGIETPDTQLSLEERQIGGLGIHLVRKMMDRVSYQRRIDKNVITVVEFLNKDKK